MECDFTGCTKTGVFLIVDRRAGAAALCDDHALCTTNNRILDCAGPSRVNTGAMCASFDVDGVIVNERTNTAIIYLRATDGTCYHFATTRLEARMVASLMMHGARQSRPLTHQAIANVINNLGAALSRVVIDEKADAPCFATLDIVQKRRPISVVMRPSDGVAMALASAVPISVTSTALTKSVERAQSFLRRRAER